jgi:hypothetical protein
MKRSASETAIAPPKTYGRFSHLFNQVLRDGYDDPTSRLSGLCENVLRYEIEPFLCVPINPATIECIRHERLKSSLNMNVLKLDDINSLHETGVIYGHSKRAVYLVGQNNLIEEIEFVKENTSSDTVGDNVKGVSMLPNGNVIYFSAGHLACKLYMHDRAGKRWLHLPVKLPSWASFYYRMHLAVVTNRRIIIVGGDTILLDIDMINSTVVRHTLSVPDVYALGFRIVDNIALPRLVLLFVHFNRCLCELVIVYAVRREHISVSLIVQIYNPSFELVHTCTESKFWDADCTVMIAVDVASNVVCSFDASVIILMRNGAVHTYARPFSLKIPSVTVDSYGRILCLNDSVISVLK